MFYSIYAEIINMLFEIVLNNKEEFLKLSNSDSDLVIKEIKSYCVDSVNYCLGTLKTILP